MAGNDSDDVSATLSLSSSSSPHRRSFFYRAMSISMGSLTSPALLPAATQQSILLANCSPSRGLNNNCGCIPTKKRRYVTDTEEVRLFLPPRTPAAQAIEYDVITAPKNENYYVPERYHYYNKPRNSCLDRFFSYSMATGMDEYEDKAHPFKSRLFDKMLRLVSKNVVMNTTSSSDPYFKRVKILELGMGTFPNAPYYAQFFSYGNPNNNNTTTTTNTNAIIVSPWGSGTLFPHGLDIISLDPNDDMFHYAIDSAKKSGLLSLPSSLLSIQNVHGVAEALPFKDGSIDAVVGTLTLCSVANPTLALSEIRRVLKPNTGIYLFWEHVLSEKDVSLAFQQRLLSPLQSIVADGCHLDRRTGMDIQNAGFRGGVDIKFQFLELGGGGTNIISPTVYGLAYA